MTCRTTVSDMWKRLAELEAENDALKAERDTLRARAVVSEHHKALSLLGKSSWQEKVEEDLRVELAESQVAKEAADAALVALRAQVEQLAIALQEWDDKGSVRPPLFREDAVWRAARAAALLVSPSTPNLEGNEMKYAEDVVVIINGRKFSVSGSTALSYRDIADLAKQSGQPSMTVCVPGRDGRSITPGESVMPIEGMVFNAFDTSNA